MVLFTYTDYLRCKEILQNNSNISNDCLPYLSLSNKTHHSHDKVYRDLLNNKQEFSLFLKDFFSYTLKYNIEKYNRNFVTRLFR